MAFSIGTALSPNIAALIVLRVLQGGSSASVQAVGAGTIADLFIPQERGQAMGLYYLGPLAGPFWPQFWVELYLKLGVESYSMVINDNFCL